MPKKPGFFRRLFTRRKHERKFDAAAVSRLLSDWTTSSQAIDEDIKSGLATVRARSRDLCTNNDYGKKFMTMLAVNVVGPNGIRLQAKVEDAQEVAVEEANAKIEAAWKQWSRKEFCTVNRRLTFCDVQRLFIQSVARDGEILISMVAKEDNPFQFALQIIEPDNLDIGYSDANKNIVMGVEKNGYKEPVAYHLFSQNPGALSYQAPGQKRQRVPATDIIHAFITERADQTRGIPWTATALKRLHMLGHYEWSELVSARVGAAKMGFFYKDGDMGYPYDDKDSSGNLIDEVEPGTFKELPAGYRFEKFDPDHPNAGFDDFIKAILRGAAAGLNVSYASLSNNLADVNYSSIRHGTIEERDIWMMLQSWMIEHFCQPVFERWLLQALMTKELALPAGLYNEFKSVSWQPRRWGWVDPLKDMQANTTAVQMGFKSRSEIIMEQGGDLDDTFARLAAEKQKADELGLNINSTREKDSKDGADDDQNRDTVSRIQLYTR